MYNIEFFLAYLLLATVDSHFVRQAALASFCSFVCSPINIVFDNSLKCRQSLLFDINLKHLNLYNKVFILVDS